MLFCPLRMGDYTEKDLNSLRKKWYKILKKEGFKDIETLAPNGQFYDMLKYPFKYDLNSPERKAQEKYFALARSFNYECNFKNEFERKVWSHHSEGVPYRKIAVTLRTRAGRVYKALRRLRKEMMEFYFDNK
jgi:hypothetical protein